jgi:hypothetical protein
MERDIDFSCSLSNLEGIQEPSKSRYLAQNGGFLVFGEVGMEVGAPAPRIESQERIVLVGAAVNGGA